VKDMVMISKEQIEEVKNRLVKTYNPIAIYLFGSYAWGTPTEDSDLDLVIIVDESNEKSYVRPRAGHGALFGMNIAKDIVVYTKDEFEHKSNDTTTLAHKIKKDGELIYARA
jgi:predicted nucleotidyltransferase